MHSNMMLYAFFIFCLSSFVVLGSANKTNEEQESFPARTSLTAKVQLDNMSYVSYGALLQDRLNILRQKKESPLYKKPSLFNKVQRFLAVFSDPHSGDEVAIESGEREEIFRILEGVEEQDNFKSDIWAAIKSAILILRQHSDAAEQNYLAKVIPPFEEDPKPDWFSH